MASTARWGDLDDKGFVVVRNFLSAPDIATLMDGFEGGRPPNEYPFGFKLIGRAPLKAAWSRIEPVLSEVRAETGIRVDTINFLTLSHYITTALTERTSYLHQDFDLDYKLTRDHLNYLNFWIPLRKPDESKSNVTLIPFDALRARSPEDHRVLVGSGGYRFVVADGRTKVFGNYGKVLSEEDATKPERELDFDIEGIAVTPSLAAGDLLLMRGDVIHRTQDSDTDRVAASVRVTASDKIIKRECALGAEAPSEKDKGAANIHTLLRSCFETLGRPQITIGELVYFSRGGSAP
jgi:hypothetical protein